MIELKVDLKVVRSIIINSWYLRAGGKPSAVNVIDYVEISTLVMHLILVIYATVDTQS